ncbi:unnamed protein product [Colias eurytheme]|nr:unnamed protein product [Colias eurytheme]
MIPVMFVVAALLSTLAVSPAVDASADFGYRSVAAALVAVASVPNVACQDELGVFTPPVTTSPIANATMPEGQTPPNLRLYGKLVVP